MKSYLLYMGLLAALVSGPVLGDTPHIVYIMADDMGCGDVQALNPEGKIRTPHLDALARGGMHFTDAHTSSSVCTPTRYGLLTGRYNWRSRLKKGVLMGYSPHLIEDNRLTVPAFLKQHGYTTAGVGKWHLGFEWQTKSGVGGKVSSKTVDFTKPVLNGPLSVGFDTFFGISASLDMPPYVYLRNDKAVTVPTAKAVGFGRPGLAAEGLSPEDVLPDLTDEAVKIVTSWGKEKDTPHFLYFPLPAPHTPIAPTEDWIGKSGINKYADFVMQVDHTVGRVTRALELAGLQDNTLVIFTADNGCSPQGKIPDMHAKGHDTHMQYRGHKADIFEGGHRVAFMARWPERIQAGTRSDQMICLTDLMATCADLVGVHLPDDVGEDSVSFLPALQGKPETSAQRKTIVHHSINGSFAIRQGKWKLCFCPGSGGWSAPRPGSPQAKKLPPLQLYDLEADPGEQHNLQAEHPEVVQRLTGEMQSIIDRGRSTPGPVQQNNGAVKL